MSCAVSPVGFSALIHSEQQIPCSLLPPSLGAASDPQEPDSFASTGVSAKPLMERVSKWCPSRSDLVAWITGHQLAPDQSAGYHPSAVMLRKKDGIQILVALLLVLVFPASADPPNPDDPSLAGAQRVEALLARAEIEQGQLRSVRARFVQRQEGPLLLQPEESTGTFYFLAPERIRWDFEPPADTTVILANGSMLTWYRALGEVEQRSLEGGAGERLQRLLGAVPSLAELKRYFDLRVTFPADPKAPYRLDLDPRSARVARRIRSVQLDLHREFYVPVFVRYEEASGGVTEIRFHDLEVDGEVVEDLFTPELPPEVVVRRVP